LPTSAPKEILDKISSYFVSVDQVVANFGTPEQHQFAGSHGGVSVDQVVANFGTGQKWGRCG